MYEPSLKVYVPCVYSVRTAVQYVVSLHSLPNQRYMHVGTPRVVRALAVEAGYEKRAVFGTNSCYGMTASSS